MLYVKRERALQHSRYSGEDLQGEKSHLNEDDVHFLDIVTTPVNGWI